MTEEAINWADYTVLIPTLNEAETISQLLYTLVGLYPGIHVLVVDDVSTDGTQDLVRRAALLPEGGEIELLERVDAEDRGITAAVIDGLKHVRTSYFLVMDGDLQHPPEVAGQLMAELHAGADMVSGARLPYKENQGVHRIAMTRLATRIARRFLQKRGLSVADPMSGFFGGKTKLVQEAVNASGDRFEPQGYKVFFDILRVIDPAIVFKQVFYQFGLRERGHSKMRPAHAFYFLRSLVK